jgi:hypothetical protein
LLFGHSSGSPSTIFSAEPSSAGFSQTTLETGVTAVRGERACRPLVLVFEVFAALGFLVALGAPSLPVVGFVGPAFAGASCAPCAPTPATSCGWLVVAEQTLAGFSTVPVALAAAFFGVFIVSFS